MPENAFMTSGIPLRISRNPALKSRAMPVQSAVMFNLRELG
jgi:hypothetical protein